MPQDTTYTKIPRAMLILDSDDDEWDIFGAEAQQRDRDVDAKIAELDLDEDV